MSRTAAVITVTVLGLAGCSATATQDGTGPQVFRPDPRAGVTGPAPVGRFYLEAGDQHLDADLYEADFELPGRYRRLTTGARVSTISGCPEKVVVAAAQEEVGFVDTLQELRDDALQLIPGLSRGSAPDLSDDCVLLYTTFQGVGDEGVGHLIRFDPRTGLSTTVASSPFLEGGSWGPGGEMLVSEQRPEGPALVIVKPDGTRTELSPGVGDLGDTLWGKGGWIAASVFPEPDPQAAQTFAFPTPTSTLFINPETGQRSTLEGWTPLAWSPNGDELLVREAEKGIILAVVTTADLTRTRTVANSGAGPVWDAVWLPA